MYREHLHFIDHVQKLLYHQVDTGANGRILFPPGSEAERMISFFAQSLTTEIPQFIPVDAMPTLTVLTPHYSVRVIITEIDPINAPKLEWLVTKSPQ